MLNEQIDVNFINVIKSVDVFEGESYFEDLLSGLIDVDFIKNVNVIGSDSDWNEEKDCFEFDERCFEIDDEVNDIDIVLSNIGEIDDLILFCDEENGNCISGWFIKDGVYYNLDIINDYMVYKMREI